MTDAVLTTLITSTATVLTVIINGIWNRKTTKSGDETTHKKLETMQRATGEMPVNDPANAPDRIVDLPTERDTRS